MVCQRLTSPRSRTAPHTATRRCTVPPPDQGWAGEEALDIEYAFAMAVNAKIYLVEACSNSYADLMHAELVAGSLVEGAWQVAVISPTVGAVANSQAKQLWTQISSIRICRDISHSATGTESSTSPRRAIGMWCAMAQFLTLGRLRRWHDHQPRREWEFQ